MVAGLGIDFNPPPTPSAAQITESDVPAASPLDEQPQTRLRSVGRLAQARSFSSNGIPESQRRPREEDLARAALADAPRRNSFDDEAHPTAHSPASRRVRIVSAANIYHDSHPADKSLSVSEGGVIDEEYGQEEEKQEQEAADIAHKQQDAVVDQYYDEDGDLLDGYAQSPMDQVSPEFGLDLPAPQAGGAAAMSVRSMSAVSSGSGTRFREAIEMDAPTQFASSKVERFEAGIRSQALPQHQHQSDPCWQEAASEVAVKTEASSAQRPARRPLPVPKKSSLRRVPAMSRPKSMMELNQLYAYQSAAAEQFAVPENEPRVDERAQLPVHPAERWTRPQTSSSAYDSSSPYSGLSDDAISPSTNHGCLSSAPTSVAGSAEIKMPATFSNLHMLPPRPESIATARSHQLSKSRSETSMRSAATAMSRAGLESLGRALLDGIPFEAGPQKADYLRQQAFSSAANIAPDSAMAMHAALLPAAQQNLQRQSTLLTAGANSNKRAKELDRLLAPKMEAAKSQYSPSTQPYDSSKIPHQATFGDADTFNPVGAGGYQPGVRRKHSTVVLEQALKGKARVELDLIPASTLVVEGGVLRGRMELRVRKEKDGEGEVWLGAVKLRIVGFEELTGNEEARHVFYHHASQISAMLDDSPLPCYASEADSEGFCRGSVGNHSFPVRLALPLDKNAKGSMSCKQGLVKYIVIGSVKLKSNTDKDRSIAHFYRDIDVLPYLAPQSVLAPASSPFVAESSKALFMGGSGKVHLRASLHRQTWVAGQRCYVDITIHNEASKKVKNLNVAVWRTTTILRAGAIFEGSDSGDEEVAIPVDDKRAQTIKKKVAEESLEMGKKGTKGNVTAKGAWVGVDQGENVDFCHQVQLPSDALTIDRGRFIGVSYALRISASGALSSDVVVELPLRVVNFASIDPPPGHQHAVQPLSETASDVSQPIRAEGQPSLQPQIASTSAMRMKSMDSLNIHDLNNMFGTRPPTRRGVSHASSSSFNSNHSTSSASIVSSDMARNTTSSGVSDLASIAEVAEPEEADSPGLPSNAQWVIDRARERQIKHQMSLDCIGSAIASARARRGNTTASNEIPAPARFNAPTDGIQLDDLEDIPDDLDDLPYLSQEREDLNWPREQASPIGDDSEDEIDVVLQTRHIAWEKEAEPPSYTRPSQVAVPPRSPGVHRQAAKAPLSPVKPTQRKVVAAPRSPPARPASAQSKRSAPASPVAKATVKPPDADSANLHFGLATPASPVKKGHAALVNASPATATRPRFSVTSASPNYGSSSPVRVRAAGLTSPRPSAAFMSPTSSPRRPVAPSAGTASPTSSSISLNVHAATQPGSPARVTFRADQETSPAKKPADPTSRKFPPTFGTRSNSNLRKVSPSAVSTVSSVSPISLDWRFNGGKP